MIITAKFIPWNCSAGAPEGIQLGRISLGLALLNAELIQPVRSLFHRGEILRSRNPSGYFTGVAPADRTGVKCLPR